ASAISNGGGTPPFTEPLRQLQLERQELGLREGRPSQQRRQCPQEDRQHEPSPPAMHARYGTTFPGWRGTHVSQMHATPVRFTRTAEAPHAPGLPAPTAAHGCPRLPTVAP
ncbi:MAG: hypothetical protein MUF01_16055, partial [Bryobacterales bacterium]|nr:hypothetical protein [Bryobacterales bacterium]